MAKRLQAAHIQESSEDSTTEQRIKHAAMAVFMAKGFDGARMQEIADEAGINKALVHYYFRSKEKLFHSIFQELAGDLYASMSRALCARVSFNEKIRIIVHDEMEQLQRNPGVPLFIMREIQRDSHRFRTLVAQSPMKDLLELFAKEVKAAVRRKEIRTVDPLDLFISLQALIRFPFIAKPMIMAVSDTDEAAYEKIIERRKRSTADFIIQSIAP